MNNIPNILTISRLLMLPLIVALLYFERIVGAPAVFGALFLYVIACLTDFLDGWLARKLKQTSAFGTFMDPISDKIFVGVLLIVIVAIGRLPDFWIIPVLFIMARELLVSGLREYLGPKNIQMPVTMLAKWKTTLQMLSLGFLIVGLQAPYALITGQLLLVAAAIVTIITGGNYLKAGLEHMKKNP